MDICDRLKQALQSSGKSQRQLASACGVSHVAVGNWMSGNTKSIPSDKALSIAKFLNVNLIWLLTGVGEPESKVTAISPEDRMPFDLVEIKQFQIRCGAGSQMNPTYEEEHESEAVYYRLDWFQKRHINPDHCRRLVVKGDSMLPVLYDGDSILVDCSEIEIQSGKIYVFRFGDEIRVKRLHKKLNGDILVHSENQMIPDETISKSEMQDFQIIGKVVDRSGSSPF